MIVSYFTLAVYITVLLLEASVGTIFKLLFFIILRMLVGETTQKKLSHL